jgi:hypothetical protein
LNSRFEIFAQNYEAIKAHNANPDSHFEMGLNKFSDMTHEEFLQHYHASGLQFPTEEKRLQSHHVNRHPHL